MGISSTESTSWSPAVDSKLGLQLTATPTEKLKAIVQLIIEQKWNGTYTPTLEWANLTYQVTPDFDVRGGRIVWPMFVRSESQNVGLANFSVRPSAELEAEMPNTHSDGLDATYRLHLGPTSHAITVFGGQSQEHYGDYVSAKSAATTLSADQVAQIFAGKASAFADGRKTHLLDLPEGADRSMFYTKSAGRDSAQMKAYWARIVFTGKGQPPTQVADADAVKKAVAADLNAVGYIDSDKVDSTVKVLATFK